MVRTMVRILNDGSPTFFQGATYSSCLDLALISRRLVSKAAWCADVDSYGSDHVPTYVQFTWYQGSQRTRVQRYTDGQAFRYSVELSCNSLDSVTDFELSIVQATRDASRSATFSPQGNPGDALYQMLRAVRRRAERRYRRTKAVSDLRASRRGQKFVQRYLEKLGRQRWRSFCSRLDPRKPLSRIWQIVRAWPSTPTQQHPFRALAVYQNRMDTDVAEDFCVQVARDNAAGMAPLHRCAPSTRIAA